jgi:hypothetical protein
VTLPSLLCASALTALLCGTASAQSSSDLAIKHLAANTALSAEQVIPIRQESWHGRQIVHLQQHHDGIPVEGARSTLTVHDGAARLLRSRRVDGVTVSTVPSLDPESAGWLAEAVLSDTVAGDADLRILPTDDGGALVYGVILLRDGLREARVDIDAHTGEIQGVQTLVSDASGTVYPGDLFDEPEEILLTDLPEDAEVLDSTVAVVRSVVFDIDGVASETHVAVTEPGGDFLFSPEEGVAEDAFAEVNTYHHITALVAYFEDVHGWSFDPITAVTGYRESAEGTFDNASFRFSEEGTYQLTFGEGIHYDYAHDPDIIAHELGHGIGYDAIEDLEYVPYPLMYGRRGPAPAGGAMKEGLSDWWAATRFDDPDIGYAYDLSGPMRSLDGDARCPDDVLGEAHFDGIVLGSVAWQVREILGAEDADQVVMGAMLMVDGGATFADFAAALSEATGILVDEGTVSTTDADAVDAMLSERGVATCGDAVEMAPGEVVRTWWMGADYYLPTCDSFEQHDTHTTPPFQFQVTAPEDVDGVLESLEVTVALDREHSAGEVAWTALIRKGGLVTYSTGEWVEIAASSYIIPMLGGNIYNASQDSEETETTLRFTAEELDLEAGETYSIALIGRNCQSDQVSISADFTIGEASSDAGVTDPEEVVGCGCATSGRLSGGAWLLAALGSGLSRRRRLRTGVPS